MGSLTSDQIKQFKEKIERIAEAGQVFVEDLNAFLQNPTRWRKDDIQIWMKDVYRDLGIACEVPATPRLTKQQKDSLEQFGLRQFFIPAIAEGTYPASFVKPNWGRYVNANQIERRPLSGKWVAVEIVAKPGCDDPNGYPNDPLAAFLGAPEPFCLILDHSAPKIIS